MTMTITQGIITTTSTDASLLLQLAAMEVDTKATDISKEQQKQQQKRPLPTEDALPWNNKRARGASPAATSTTPAPSSTRPTATSHTVTNFLPTSRNSRGHRFLRLHLQLLQALYPNNDNNNNNNNNNENESQVPSELWKRIRHYLHTRGRIRALEEQVHDYQKRLNELIDVCDEEEKEDELNRFLAHDPYYGWNNYSARMTMMMPPPPPPQYNMPPPPPSYGGSGRNWMFGTHTSTMTRNSPSSSFSFHERMSSSSSSSSNLLTGHDHSDGTSAGSMRIHPFGLVAGIWKEEYRLAVQALQKATHPFQPRLLQDVCHRVQGLEELLQGSQTTTGVAPNTSSIHATAVDTTMDTSNAPSSGTAAGTTAAASSSIASMDVSGQELPIERPPTPATAEKPGPQTAEKEGSSSTAVAPSGSENSSSDKDAMDATTGASTAAATATATATATNVPLTNAIFQQEVQDQLSGTATTTTTTTTTTNEVEKAPTIAKDAGKTGRSKGVTFQGVHKQQQQQQGESILLENEEDGDEDEEERLARHETKLRLWTLLYLDLTTTTTFDNSRS